MAKVFISHASDDRQPAGEVRRWLVTQGHKVFLDQHPRDGIEVGEEWEQRLHERLRWADAVVCVVTSAFLASTWCTYEVACARAQGSRLLPVQAEPKVEHPLLKSTHHVDLSTTGRATLVEALRRVPSRLGVLPRNTGGVYSVAFSPDGRTLATAGYYNVARWWDVSDPRNPSLLATLTGHTKTVFSVAFSPDRRTLATGSADTTALLWDTDVDSVATQICRTTSPITRRDWEQYLPDFPYQPPCLPHPPLARR